MKRVFIAAAILFLVSSSLTQAMILSGTVKDASSGDALSNIFISLRSNSILARDTTDETGAYSITYDTPGEYTLRATDLGGIYPQTSVTVTIVDAEIDQTADIVMVKPSTAIVSGTVTDSATGDAIGGAVVSMRAGTSTLSATTDSDGAFSIEAPYAKYRITATAKAYSSQSDSVTVADTASQTVDLQLVALDLSSITGKITDSDGGSAIQDAKIVVFRASGMTRTRVDSALSSEEGDYSIDSIPLGTYSITVTCTAYDQKSVDSVTLSETEAVTVDVELVKTIYGSITGTVTDAASESAVADAKVVLYSGSGIMRTRVDSAVTEEEGTYSFDSVTLGTYSITVTCETYDQKTDSVTIDDESAKTVDIALDKTVYSTVTGTITDSTDGEALSEAKVVLYSGSGFLRTRVDSTVTEEEGTYSFESIPTGTYSITVTRDDFFSKTDSVTITDTTTKELDIALAKVFYCTITGTVTDSATGEAFADIPVVIWYSTNGLTWVKIDSTNTDSSGAYSLDSAFTGTYVRSITTGYVAKSILLTVTSESSQEIDLALSRNTNAVRSPKNTSNVHGVPSITVMHDGTLRLINGNTVTAIRLYSLNGRLLWKRTLNPEAPPSVLSIGKPISCGQYIVRLERKGSMLQQTIFIP